MGVQAGSGCAKRAHRTDWCRHRRNGPHGGASVGDNPRHVRRQDSLDSIGAAALRSRGVSPTAAAAAASSAASRSTDFGSTVFDVVAPTATRRRGLDSAFDVCHVGVVLRAILFVHGTMAIGLVFGASSFSVWLARSPLPLQWTAVIAFGAIAAFCASRLIAAMLPDAAAVGLGALVGWGPVLAGAAIAASIFQWLRLLAQATLPAETTARLAELQSRIRPH